VADGQPLRAICSDSEWYIGRDELALGIANFYYLTRPWSRPVASLEAVLGSTRDIKDVPLCPPD